MGAGNFDRVNAGFILFLVEAPSQQAARPINATTLITWLVEQHTVMRVPELGGWSPQEVSVHFRDFLHQKKALSRTPLADVVCLTAYHAIIAWNILRKMTAPANVAEGTLAHFTWPTLRRHKADFYYAALGWRNLPYAPEDWARLAYEQDCLKILAVLAEQAL